MNFTTACRAIAVVLLGCMGIHRYLTVYRPESVEQYHQRIRGAAKLVPVHIDAWVGSDIPVPPQAIAVLDPNAMISRRYVNVENGTHAGLMLVHCSDAHDMVGHFPLRCYPARGWDLRASRERDWNAGGLRVTGTEYEFTMPQSGVSDRQASIVVVNCLLRPNGRIFRDMGGMSKSIAGALGQSSGAGQLQIYFDGSVRPEQRDAAVETLSSGCAPLLGAILADPEQEVVHARAGLALKGR
jgi:hypothetical protein